MLVYSSHTICGHLWFIYNLLAQNIEHLYLPHEFQHNMNAYFNKLCTQYTYTHNRYWFDALYWYVIYMFCTLPFSNRSKIRNWNSELRVRLDLLTTWNIDQVVGKSKYLTIKITSKISVDIPLLWATQDRR